MRRCVKRLRRLANSRGPRHVRPDDWKRRPPVARSATQACGTVPAQFRLALSVTPGNAREFELWRSGMSPLFALDAPDARARSSYGAEMTSYLFGDVAVSSGWSSAAVYERTTQTIARGEVDNICLTVYSDGGCALDGEGRSDDVRIGDVFITDMTRTCTARAPAHEKSHDRAATSFGRGKSGRSRRVARANPAAGESAQHDALEPYAGVRGRGSCARHLRGCCGGARNRGADCSIRGCVC